MGDSTNEKDLLFTVKRSSVFQLRTDLEVFLATNTNKNECDFKVKGEFHKRSSVIYKGNTSVVVAQVYICKYIYVCMYIYVGRV